MAIQEHGILSAYPQLSLPSLLRRARVSDQTVRHELAVMDVKAAFFTSVRANQSLSIQEFSTWPRLLAFEAQHPKKGRMVVKPDGFFRIQEEKPSGESKDYTFYLEVDRSTEVLDIIIDRSVCYHAFYKAGDFAVLNGASKDNIRKHAFRVLIVCKSEERRKNITDLLIKNAGHIRMHIWLTTMEETRKDPLGAIWHTPTHEEKISIISPQNTTSEENPSTHVNAE